MRKYNTKRIKIKRKKKTGRQYASFFIGNEKEKILKKAENTENTWNKERIQELIDNSYPNCRDRKNYGLEKK